MLFPVYEPDNTILGEDIFSIVFDWMRPLDIVNWRGKLSRRIDELIHEKLYGDIIDTVLRDPRDWTIADKIIIWWESDGKCCHDTIIVHAPPANGYYQQFAYMYKSVWGREFIIMWRKHDRTKYDKYVDPVSKAVPRPTIIDTCNICKVLLAFATQVRKATSAQIFNVMDHTVRMMKAKCAAYNIPYSPVMMYDLDQKYHVILRRDHELPYLVRGMFPCRTNYMSEVKEGANTKYGNIIR